jgi:hypothetical protein
MKGIILLLALTGIVCGQNATNVAAEKTSHSNTRLTFQIVNGTAVRLRIRYTIDPATCDSGTGGQIQATQYNGPVPMLAGSNESSILLSGLNPGTHYHACIELSGDYGSTWSAGPGNMTDVYTLALDSSKRHPYPPTPPQSFTTVNYPDTANYHVYNLTQCSDFIPTFNQAVQNQINQGAVIKLPAGMNCSGSLQGPGVAVYWYTYLLAARQPDVLNSSFDQSDSSVTIPGATAQGWGTEGHKVRFANPNHIPFPNTNTADCGGGQLAGGEVYWLHATGTTDRFKLYCNASAAEGGTPMVLSDSGAGSGFWAYPAPRDPLNWIVIRTATDDSNFAPQGTRVSPSWQPKMATFTNAIEDLSNQGHNSNRALLTIGDPDGGNPVPMGKIWIAGLEFTNPTNPWFSPDPPSWYPFIWVTQYAGDIVFDRNYFHSTEPGRVSRFATEFNGHNVAMINNYVSGITYWQPGRKNGDYVLAGTGATSFTISPGRTGTAYGVHEFTSVASFDVTPTAGTSGWVEVGYDLKNNRTGISLPTGWTLKSVSGGGITLYSISHAADNATGSCDNLDPGMAVGATEVWAPISCVHYSNGGIDNGANGSPWCSHSPDVHQGCGTSGLAGIVAGMGPGPYNFSNNYFQATGLFMHFDDTGGRNNFSGYWGQTHWRNRDDFTIYRNHFHWPRPWMFGTPFSEPAKGGNYEWYGGRQPLEWKGGSRISVLGNIFDGNYADGTANNHVPTLTAVSREINDVDIRDNTLMHMNAGISGLMNVEGTLPQFWPSNRERVQNNLMFDINGMYLCTTLVQGCGVADGSGGPGNITEGPFGSEDYIFDHNTVVGQAGTSGLMWLFEDQPTEGAQITNNILTANATQGGPAKIDGQVQGDPCGDYTGPSVIGCKFTPNRVFTNNVWASNDTTQVASLFNTTDQGNNFFFPNSTDYSGIGFFNCDVSDGGRACTAPASDFHLKAHYASGATPYDGVYQGRSTDGKDLGADIDELESVQGKVTLTGASPAGSPGVWTINFVAPDSAACTVDYSTSDPAVVTSFTRISDSGGQRARTVAIPSLASGSVVYFRVNCAAQQPTGSFRVQ